MTLDLHIGRMTTIEVDDGSDAPREKPYVEWDGLLPEDDGCTMAVYALGEPYRSIPWGSVPGLFRAVPALNEMLAGWDGSNDWQLFPITAKHAQKIYTVPLPQKDEYIRERVIWLKYWVRRAREEYGDEAGILLT
jgi:hypothetical protein